MPAPGEELRQLVRAGRGAGRAVWRVGPYFAPRIEYVAVRQPESGEPVLHRPLAVDLDRRPYFKPRVLLYLETGHSAIHDDFASHDRAQARRLAAAVAYDLHGLNYGEVTEEIRKYDESRAGKEVKAGRELWRHLPAWPWCYWPNGEPPADWRESGPDASLAAAFATWATERPILSDAV